MATEFVNKYLKEAREFTSDAEVLKYAVEHATLDGLYIELGVCTGKTINFIAALKPYETIYGFDSFEGLPEDWVRGDKIFKAGTFGFRDTTFLPPTLHNVTLIKGWFETTIPSFIADQNPKKPVAFLHVDSDLYSSAHFALKTLQEYIQIGTIIVFDELYNYPGFENHEWKALEEFLAFTGFQIKFLAFNSNHQQVAIEIISLQ